MPPSDLPSARTTPAGPVAFGPFVLDAAEARLSRDGTALALRAAASDALPDGVWLLRLDALDSQDGAAPLLSTLAQTLHLGPAAAASADALGRALGPLSLRLALDGRDATGRTLGA